jgi:hypothetical protein
MHTVTEQVPAEVTPSGISPWGDGQQLPGGPENDSEASPRNSLLLSICVLIFVWAASLVWLAIHLNRGWVPHDEGMLGQSAERVLGGQLPHRDFIEMYTGGLSYLHAAAFRILGTNLLSIRRMLFLFFALWVPVFYYCASRFAKPLAAGLVTLLAVVWSVPIYPASMPSWYNMFFATFAVAALLRFLEVRTARWLFLAGLCGGFSFLIKSPGLYLVAGMLLFLLFAEQSQMRGDRGFLTSENSGTGKTYKIFLDVSVMVFVIALVFLVRKLLDISELYFFVIPGLVLGLVLFSRERRDARIAAGLRFQRLLRTTAPFLAGVALPVVVFLIPYAASHSLGSFYRGVFVLPFLRISKAVFLPPGIRDLISSIPLIGLLSFAVYSKRRESLAVAGAILAFLGTVFVVCTQDRIVYSFAFKSIQMLVPILIIAGAIVISRGGNGWKAGELIRQRLFLVLSAAALCSLVQFPYSSPTYFCYVAPLIALAAFAILHARKTVPRILPVAFACFYIAFAMFRVTPGYLLDWMNQLYLPAQPAQALPMSRGGGLQVEPDGAQKYGRLVTLVHEKAKNGPLYAGPDAPEVYFLSGMQNPTPMIFDFFEDYSEQSPRILKTLDTVQPNVIVINRLPGFTTPFSGGLREKLEARYPEMTNIGKFQVRWRE